MPRPGLKLLARLYQVGTLVLVLASPYLCKKRK